MATLEALKEEVELICGSPGFRNSRVQQKLLRYLAGEALAGRGRELNQYLIATAGMGLGEDFEPLSDSKVRVWGGRLRYVLDREPAGPLNLVTAKSRYIPDFATLFNYSQEDGSRAAKMSNQVPTRVKNRRHRDAMKLSSASPVRWPTPKSARPSASSSNPPISPAPNATPPRSIAALSSPAPLPRHVCASPRPRLAGLRHRRGAASVLINHYK